VKRAALSSLRRPLRVKPARSGNHAGPLDETKDNTPGDCSAPGQVRKRGRAAPQVSDYSVSAELPENIPISENELRALEILLGIELKELLAKSAGKPLK
jgi:hypothetical protein